MSGVPLAAYICHPPMCEWSALAVYICHPPMCEWSFCGNAVLLIRGLITMHRVNSKLWRTYPFSVFPILPPTIKVLGSFLALTLYSPQALTLYSPQALTLYSPQAQSSIPSNIYNPHAQSSTPSNIYNLQAPS